MSKRKILYKDINIERLDNFVSDHQSMQNTINGYPLFSSVEFSINGACNRRCSFCPRVDPKLYPNILNNMDFDIYKNFVNDLKKVSYTGRVSFSGYGEPLLTKKLYKYVELCKKENPLSTVEIVSNGDPLLTKKGKEILSKLFESGLDNIRISMYDGAHQIKEFEKLKSDLKLNHDQFILRKRYLGPDQSYGLTISNRAGSVELKNNYFELKALEEPLLSACYYPFYKVLIDYNGDVQICSNDWKKKRIVGNISTQSILNIWVSEEFIDIRKKLANKDRSHDPCNQCDVNGTLNGKSAFDNWEKKFK